MTLPTTSNVADPTRAGYHARLGSLFVQLATNDERELIVESAPLQAQRVDTTSSAEEVSNEFGLLFSRSDFSGGEGLARAHRRNAGPNDATRYYDSRNINVDSDGRASLLCVPSQQWASTADPHMGVWYPNLSKSVFTSGTNVTYASATPGSPTVESPHAGESATSVTGLAVLGDDLYAALNANGIHKRSGGTWAHWSDCQATNVWSLKDRIFANGTNGADKGLFEAGSGAGSTLMMTLPTGHNVTDMTDAGAFLLACASNGYVYSFTFDGTATAFAAQSRLPGEIPRAIESLFGVVLLTTSQQTADGWVGRLYRATLTADGVLDEVTLIREWEGATDRAPRGLSAATRASVWMGVPQAGAGETHLWRYDLSYGALHRAHIVGDGEGHVRSVFTNGDGDLRWGIDGIGNYDECDASDTLAETGYLIGPMANFFTEDDKSWAGVKTILDAAPAGSRVTLAYTTKRSALDDPESNDWTNFASLSSVSDDFEVSFPAVTDGALAMRLTLEPGVAGTSPILRSFTVRAYPGAGDTLFQLPVNVSDSVQRRGKVRIRMRDRGDELYTALLGLEGTAMELELLRDGKRFSGTVQRVSQPSRMLTSRGSIWRVATVVFRGRQLEDFTTSDNSFGVGLFGEGLFGSRSAA